MEREIGVLSKAMFRNAADVVIDAAVDVLNALRDELTLLVASMVKLIHTSLSTAWEEVRDSMAQHR